jgi:hypothetical protein
VTPLHVLAVFFVLTFLVSLLATRRSPRVGDLIWSAWNAVWSLVWTVDGNPVGAVLHAAYAAYLLWQWWNRRGRKDAEKALGVVRDLGHRLTVVNVPAEGGAR